MTIHAILIDPYTKSLSLVGLDTSDYKNIYKLIDCSTFDVIGGLNDHNDAIYIDDEGLLTQTDATRYFTIDGRQPIAGKGLVVGTDDEGNTIAPHTTIAELEGRISWPDVRFSHFTTFEGETDHPVLGKVMTIGNEAHFVPLDAKEKE